MSSRLMIQERKRRLRQELLKKLRDHKEDDRRRRSSSIARKLFYLREYVHARTVLFYLSFDGEVDTIRMIKRTIAQGKRVAVPVIRKETRELIPSELRNYDAELTRGPYGTQHPKDAYIRPLSLSALDLVIVPGLAFDTAGNRLGRGLGFYDRFLGRLPKDVPTVGLAFDFQMVRDFPPLESHDHSVTKVLFA